jgi:hypothetical protein
MENSYWVIGLAGIVVWGAVVATWIVFRARRGDPDVVMKRLDSIDNRLAAVEKTLNDIP